MSRAPHEPTEASREQVKAWAVVGLPQDTMARSMGIDAKTLRKHYRDELDLSTDLANAAIAGVLFAKAKAGDSASIFFWLKTRAGWRETAKPEDLDLSAPPMSISISVSQSVGDVRITKPDT